MRRGNWLCLSLFTVAIGLVWCGDGADKWTAERPKPFPAQGTVLLDKQPVEGATVVFHSDGHKHAATGLTDAAGVFHLQTYDIKDGAIPGKYKVSITKVTVTSTTASEQSSTTSSAAPTSEWITPKKYSNPATSGLTAEVKEVQDAGGNNFTFELQK
jgi:hypothetical protein